MSEPGIPPISDEFYQKVAALTEVLGEPTCVYEQHAWWHGVDGVNVSITDMAVNAALAKAAETRKATP